MNAIPLHAEPSSADAQISASIRALIAGTGIDREAFAGHLGISVAAFYNKLAGRSQWKLQEAIDAAAYVGADLADLISGRVLVRKSPTSRVADGAFAPLSQTERARRDSNPQPSDP